MRRALTWSLASLSLFTAAPLAAAEETPSTEACFDLAVVAKVIRETPTPVEDDPGSIVFAWPWRLSVVVKQRLVGSTSADRIEVTAIQHTYRGRRGYVLMFLRRSSAAGYTVLSQERNILKDDSGRFVMPLAGPIRASGGDVSFIPADYARMLQPIKYRQRAAWWLRKPYLQTVFIREPDQDPDVDPSVAKGWDTGVIDLAAYPWGMVTANRVVATRGLVLTDLIAPLAERRCGP